MGCVFGEVTKELVRSCLERNSNLVLHDGSATQANDEGWTQKKHALILPQYFIVQCVPQNGGSYENPPDRSILRGEDLRDNQHPARK